jgi:hypothetical protein
LPKKVKNTRKLNYGRHPIEFDKAVRFFSVFVIYSR